MRPIILTNGFRRPRATRFATSVETDSKTNVYACVEELITVIHDRLGASPLMLPTLHDRDTVLKLLDHVDGIMLPGAASNIHPTRFGEEPNGMKQTFDEQHDTADLFLIKAARDKGIPFFGICRAMQAMNLAFGGEHYQAVPVSNIEHMCSASCDGHEDKPEFMHDIRVAKQGLLAKIFGQETLSVNSIHEQGVKEPGKDLYVEAIAADGIVEAISYPGVDFFLGVQWHPETMPDNMVSAKLFASFKDAVAKHFHKRG